MKSFSALDRAKYLESFDSEIFDLLIIGGGINGAGCAREATMRGMKVALVEADDFASGTSSRSSKLIHGGLRYLENKEFSLVFEALSERRILLEMAPHLVHPLKFLIPLYSGGKVGMNLMGLGMLLYDVLALFEAPEGHRRLNPQKACEFAPSLAKKDLLGAYTYYDAYMDDDRLVFETLRSAHNTELFRAVNYVEASRAEFNKNGHVKTVRLIDKRTDRPLVARAKHIISTVGPWTDELGGKFFKDWKPKLRPTKGVHLTFSRDRFPLPSAVTMGAESRIVFAIPRHEMVIVGTTDTDFSGNPSTVRVEKEDVDYLLGVIDKYFPGAKINRDDIISSYTGVRPLVHDGSATEGKTSREHTILTDEHHVTYVMGGKYTTYRLIAEQAIDEVLKHFPIEDRVKWNSCNSKVPLNPLATVEIFGRRDEWVSEIQDLSGLALKDAQSLFDRHGAEALKLVKRFGKLEGDLEFEAAHAILNTMCLSLSDFYQRRLPLILSRKDHGLTDLPRVMHIMRDYLNWSETQCATEVDNLQKVIAESESWKKQL